MIENCLVMNRALATASVFFWSSGDGQTLFLSGAGQDRKATLVVGWERCGRTAAGCQLRVSCTEFTKMIGPGILMVAHARQPIPTCRARTNSTENAKNPSVVTLHRFYLPVRNAENIQKMKHTMTAHQ